MRTVNQVARINEGRCKRCAMCVRVCPVLAVTAAKEGKLRTVKIDEACAWHARSVRRDAPRRL